MFVGGDLRADIVIKFTFPQNFFSFFLKGFEKINTNLEGATGGALLIPEGSLR